MQHCNCSRCAITYSLCVGQSFDLLYIKLSQCVGWKVLIIDQHFKGRINEPQYSQCYGSMCVHGTAYREFRFRACECCSTKDMSDIL